VTLISTILATALALAALSAPLPAEAQLAPAFAVCVGDMDGDGKEDVFLSQNFFAVAPETSRRS